MDRDARAGRAEGDGEGTADAPAGAGDQCDPVAQLHAASATGVATGRRRRHRADRRAATRSSCRSSQAYGTRMPPSIRGPSAAPCQSDPPL
jgi:hypothetical protein